MRHVMNKYDKIFAAKVWIFLFSLLLLETAQRASFLDNKSSL